MAHFPLEIWGLISNHLHPDKIANLALVSSDIQSLVRPLLYRHVVLKDFKPNFRTTVKLLIREDSLAKQVNEFELISTPDLTHPKSDGQTYVQELLKLFQNLTQLRALSLIGCPSFDGDDCIAFSSVLHSLDSSLTEFRYHDYDQDGEFPQLELSHIKTFTWDTKWTLLHPTSFSVMELSLSSLVDIRILPYMDDRHSAGFIRFCDFRFPCLKSFTIGTFFDIIDDGVPDALTRFLVGHPSITYLSLGFDTDDEFATEFSEELLESNMLPSLLGFHGRSTCVAMLARRGCGFFKQLMRLSTGGGNNYDTGRQLDDMMRALADVGGMPSLKRLHFDPGEEGGDHTDAVQEWMHNFSELCPNLKYWSGGGLNHDFTDVSTFAGLFSPFLRLEHIKIPTSYIPLSSPYSSITKETVSWLKSLAEQCPSLQSLGFRRGAKYMTCAVDRDADGLVSDIVISDDERHLRPREWLVCDKDGNML